jgi:hypothetical protein
VIKVQILSLEQDLTGNERRRKKRAGCSGACRGRRIAGSVPVCPKLEIP